MEVQEGLGVSANTLIDRADLSLRTADHMAYVIYPLLKDVKLIKKVIEDLRSTATNVINSLLLNEYNHKRIPYLRDRAQNLELFKKNFSRFGFTQEEIKILIIILDLVKKEREGSFEFIRGDKLVIMSNGMRVDTITLDQLKIYLTSLKIIIQKAKNYLKKEVIL
ncbi:MAG: hypothetical protein NTX24_05385 [Candidatus Pacearchaeota archaeon]|nr:hypothetical protein [Candidatus Pacearchaeota archaeon]